MNQPTTATVVLMACLGCVGCPADEEVGVWLDTSAIGSDAAGAVGNPNPQGFSNGHNEGRHDFRALVQGTDIYNFGLLTTSNVGLIWLR